MNYNYRRIEKAIRYLAGNYSRQPSLEEAASAVNLSASHFQRIFSEWVGVSPKTFVRYISLQKAKTSLHQKATLFDAASDAGLSGTGRLHDLFVKIEGMTPGEYKKGGRSLTIRYSLHESPFGGVMVASTGRGICKISFLYRNRKPEDMLFDQFPNADIQEQALPEHGEALQLFKNDPTDTQNVRIHVKGTPFQINVWEALMKIPEGSVRSYSEVAEQIGNPKASRAVGSAVAKNPIAYLIPCHRVIKSTGEFGNYRWGSDRKTAMIGWEAAQRFNKESEQESKQTDI